MASNTSYSRCRYGSNSRPIAPRTVNLRKIVLNHLMAIIFINKKGHPLRVEDTYIWRALQGLSTETVYLRHSANAEDTILAGRSAASPKAPPYGSL